MKYEGLLEKKEEKQLMLLKQLMLKSGRETIQVLAKQLGISKSSLESYTIELIDELAVYKDGISLTYDGQWLALEVKSDFSLSTVERDFYIASIKYQILVYVMDHHDFSTVALASELRLSESTLFRKIKELNSLLDEFDISIWQGKLIGEESQIRYFYFQFYWFLGHYSGENVTTYSLNYIKMIEKGLAINLSPDSRKRVGLWLWLTKKRINYAHQQHTVLLSKFGPYVKDPLFIKVREVTMRAFGHYAVEVEEEEAMLQYCFLISMSILSADDFYDYSLVRSRFTPTAMGDTVILESILLYYRPLVMPRKLEVHIYYLLAQIHPMLYFFKGDIEVYDSGNIWKLEEDFSGHSIRPLADHLLTLITERLKIDDCAKNSLIELTRIKYLSVLAVIDYQVNREIKVGIDLKMEDLFKEATTNMLIVQLRSLNGVKCDMYQVGTKYDLVITNRNDRTYPSQLYVISELGTDFDMKQLKQLIRHIYQTKNETRLNPVHL